METTIHDVSIGFVSTYPPTVCGLATYTESLIGAIAGAMTSTPWLKSINEFAHSNIPSLGYAGTYTFSNVFLTLGGAAMVSM